MYLRMASLATWFTYDTLNNSWYPRFTWVRIRFTHDTQDCIGYAWNMFSAQYTWYALHINLRMILGFTQNFTQDTHYCTIYAYNLVYARYAWYTLIIIYTWYAEYTQDLRNRKSIYAWFTHGTQEQLNLINIRMILRSYAGFTHDTWIA
jgi:hypothetical protein